jgi:Domain of unknown function (DUF4124)
LNASHPLKSILLAATVLTAIPALGQSTVIQKWVDAQGHVHFGDVPPPEAKTTDILIKVTPPSETPPAKPAAALKANDLKNERLTREAKEAEQERKKKEQEAIEATAKNAECQKRAAAFQRDARTVRNWNKNGPGVGDAGISQDEARLTKDCPGY